MSGTPVLLCSSSWFQQCLTWSSSCLVVGGRPANLDKTQDPPRGRALPGEWRLPRSWLSLLAALSIPLFPQLLIRFSFPNPSFIYLLISVLLSLNWATSGLLFMPLSVSLFHPPHSVSHCCGGAHLARLIRLHLTAFVTGLLFDCQCSSNPVI